MTHDLIKNILDKIACKITKIEICDIKENTFYAVINMENQTYGKLKIDSRPSDAIALAVRSKCDIYAADHIIQSAGLEIQTIEDEVAQFKDFLEHVTPDDFKQEE